MKAGESGPRRGRRKRGAPGRGENLDIMKASAWISRFAAALRRNAFLCFLRKHLLITGIVVLLLVPLGAVLLGYITRPPAGTAGQAVGLSTSSPDGSGGDKIAKPPAGKPLIESSQAPLPVLSSPGPAPAIPNQSPSGLPGVPSRPLGPVPGVQSALPNPALPAPSASTAVKPPYTPMVYSARHDKHFGASCSGQLTLDTSGLTFRCGDDSGGSVQVALADIEAVDANGIRLTSGKKYHFSIAGMSKESEQALFADWLTRVR